MSVLQSGVGCCVKLHRVEQRDRAMYFGENRGVTLPGL
jgi:hypothetical protein